MSPFTRTAPAPLPSPPMAGSSETFRLEGAGGIGALREEWLALAAALPGTSYFQTPDWVVSWWETVGGRPPTVGAVWRGASGALEAIALLSRTRQPLHRWLPLPVPTWTNAGSGPGAADHCGWLARPERAGAVRDWMLRQAAGGSLLLQNLDPEVGAGLERVARPVWHTVCPRTLLAADAPEVARSANFRQQLRSRERKLLAAGVTLRWIDPPEMTPRVLETLLALHQNRWRAKGGRSSFGPEHLRLHGRLLERGAPGRGPAAVVAEHEGRWIGVLYGFWWKEVFAYYQMGWDPEWARFSLGTLLLREGIRMAEARGGRVFDFLRGTEPVKYRFGAQERNDTSWLVSRGVSGRVLELSFAARRLAHSVRRRWS